jgi:hypothetical protein
MSNLRLKIALLMGLTVVGNVCAQAQIRGSKLLGTSGLTAVGGAGGGGLATWALIGGYESEHQTGANASLLKLSTQDVVVDQVGGSVGFNDRVELSVAQQRGYLSARANMPPASGLRFDQTVVGLKVRLFGQAVYDQDKWYPQVSLGVQFKDTGNTPLVTALGATDTNSVDYYISGTKVMLQERLLLNATLRSTRSNQTGLGGFGGPLNNGRELKFEGSLGYFLTRRSMIGAEYLGLPDKLPMAHTEDWKDVFIAFFPSKTVSCVLAYADLGTFAFLGHQDGVFTSIQIGF